MPRRWSSPFREGGVGLQVDLNHRIKNTYGPLDFSEYPGGTVADPFGWSSRMPWTANLSMSLAMPLPFTKDFGTNGSLTNLEMFLAESDHHASVAQERTVLNRTLESALLAYMTLVRTREEIVTLAGHQQFLESLGASVRRRFDAGSVTLYDLKQVETDIENARDRQEIAWNGYVQASNALRRLLALREEVVFVPDVEEALAAVRLPMTRVEPLLAEGVGETLLADHPELVAVQAQLEASRANTRFRDTQTRPDVSLSFSYGPGAERCCLWL